MEQLKGNQGFETKPNGNILASFLMTLHYNELLVITLTFSLQTQNLQCRLMGGVILHLSYPLLIPCMIVYSRVGAMQRLQRCCYILTTSLSLPVCTHEQHLCLLSDWCGSKEISVLPSLYTREKKWGKKKTFKWFFCVYVWNQTWSNNNNIKQFSFWITKSWGKIIEITLIGILNKT